MDGVRLRAVAAADVDRIADYCADFDLARMTSRIPHPYGRDDAEAYVAQPQAREIRFAIEADAGGFAGVVSWTDREDREGVAEFGYWLGRPFWGRGLATVAARLAADRALREGGVRLLTACVFQDNPASARVLEKTGFSRTQGCVGHSIARATDAPTWLYERAAG